MNTSDQVNLLRNGLNHTYISEVTNCGSKDYMTDVLTENNYRDYTERYIKKLKDVDEKFNPWVVLTEKNKKEFIGNAIAIRSILFCRNEEGYCQTCFGDSFKRNGVKVNLSSLPMLISSTIMNKEMKSFHSTAVERDAIDFTKDIKII